ncbi:hypothetical protein GOV11_04275 [Candidatus Woesearchaeota archaeon]|nr:hypothetical protein [Candidatus Woesearchaeota archaeon]
MENFNEQHYTRRDLTIRQRMKVFNAFNELELSKDQRVNFLNKFGVQRIKELDKANISIVMEKLRDLQ